MNNFGCIGLGSDVVICNSGWVYNSINKYASRNKNHTLILHHILEQSKIKQIIKLSGYDKWENFYPTDGTKGKLVAFGKIFEIKADICLLRIFNERSYRFYEEEYFYVFIDIQGIILFKSNNINIDEIDESGTLKSLNSKRKRKIIYRGIKV